MSEPTPAAETEGPDNLPRTEVDLVARLEALRDRITKGSGIARYTFVVNREEVETEVQELIALLPREIKRARRIVQHERELLDGAHAQARETIDEARAEADEILNAARQEAERLVDESAIKQKALEEAERIVLEAQEFARQIQQNAFDYAHQVLERLEEEANKVLTAVREGKQQLEQPPEQEQG